MRNAQLESKDYSHRGTDEIPVQAIFPLFLLASAQLNSPNPDIRIRIYTWSLTPVGQELNLFMKKEGVGFLNTLEEEDDLPVWICLCEVLHDNSNSI